AEPGDPNQGDYVGQMSATVPDPSGGSTTTTCTPPKRTPPPRTGRSNRDWARGILRGILRKLLESQDPRNLLNLLTPVMIDRLIEAILGDYEGYKALGMSDQKALEMAILRNLPVVGSSFDVADMIEGWSSRGGDFGRPLTPEDYGERGLGVAQDTVGT